MIVRQCLLIIIVFAVLLIVTAKDPSTNQSSSMLTSLEASVSPTTRSDLKRERNITLSADVTTKLANGTVIKRRLRKRKRRPQKVPNVEIANSRIGNRHPQSLDPVQQVWDAMERESLGTRPNSRRRLLPEYPASRAETTTTTAVNYEEIRNPYQALQEIDEKFKSRAIDAGDRHATDLKSILKNVEGTLSLSEILQKQNLTLYDLLRGGTNAISALTQVTANKFQGESDDKRFDGGESTATGINAVAKSTTGSKRDRFQRIDKNSKLPITSAKLLKTKSTTEPSHVGRLPPKAVQIKLNDIYGFSDVLRKRVSDYNEDDGSNGGPLKMVIDLANVADKTTSTTAPNDAQEKLKIKSAREEILDFVGDAANRANVLDTLRSRNMTLDELIQLRERGSNRGRLLDIFGDTDGFVPSSIVTGRRPKNIEFGGVSGTATKDESATSFPVYKVEGNVVQDPYWKSIHPVTLQKNNKKNDIVVNAGVITNVIDLTDSHQNFQTEKTASEMYANVRREEENGNEFDSKLNSMTGKLNVETIDRHVEEDDYEEEGEGELFDWPKGVKSALIASFAIIAASLLIFLSILIVCKLTQKTKRKLCYRQNLINAPILNDKPKRTIRTIMCDTLSRKNYWRSMVHNRDSIWDNNRIPFQ